MLRSRVDRLISFEQKNLNLTGVDGPSVVRHDRFLNLRSLTFLFNAIVSILPKRKYVRMHDQIGQTTHDWDRIATFIISILPKRMSLNPVSKTI